MKKRQRFLKDSVFTISVLAFTYGLIIFLEQFFMVKTIIPMMFVLGVFVIATKTRGYFFGVTASLISVLLVNYAFTHPYYKFEFISTESLASEMVMLVVAIVTGTMTTRIGEHEKSVIESEKERVRANLLRAVSHDLRTPLTSIYGGCSAIIENYDRLDKEQQLHLLGDIQEDSQWLIRMVENLLSITRINGKQTKIKKIPTVLEELVDLVVIKFRKRWPEQAIQVEIPEEFVMVNVDPMLIEQVIINLLENAVKHAVGMTELKIIVSLDGNKVLFEVMDNGCGIPTEKMSKLFTGYLEQVDKPIDGKRSNMGIGLSVCATIIRAHGSEIYAKNRPEGGTTFFFTLEMEGDEDDE